MSRIRNELWVCLDARRHLLSSDFLPPPFPPVNWQGTIAILSEYTRSTFNTPEFVYGFSNILVLFLEVGFLRFDFKHFGLERSGRSV